MAWDLDHRSGGESAGEATASNAGAPGKRPRNSGGKGVDQQTSVQAAIAMLPPELFSAMMTASPEQAAKVLQAVKPGKGILDAAFTFARSARGPAFVETLSTILFPNKSLNDWLGVSELIGPRDELADEACVGGATVHEAKQFLGIQLYIQTAEYDLKAADRVAQPGQVGPDRAPPYLLHPQLADGKLLGYFAFHEERNQYEWTIGPESLAAFVAAAPLYAGSATVSLPGASAVPGSQADGADKPITEPSLVEKEAQGFAPWQFAKQAADDTGGGTAMVAAANGAIRIANYELPARQLAARLEADVKSGKLDHQSARDQAVTGRNQLLESTRKDITPGARRASQAIKSDNAKVTVAEMQERKTAELLKAYSGVDKKGRPLRPKQAAIRREILDADSAMWAQYAKAVDADPAMLDDAMRALGESPEVSRAIVRSAGRPNRLVTGAAAFQVVGGAVVAVLGAIDMYQEIADADDAHKLHAAARAFAGFTGGIVGAEGAVFVASALTAMAVTGGVGAPVILVVSLLAGAIGGGIGAHAGASLVDMIAQSSVGGLVPSHSMTAAGGLGGIHSRGNPQGRNVGQTAADAIFKLDAQIARFDRSIPSARNREELQALQRRRLELLEERANLEDLLMAVRVGAFEANESRPAEPEPDVPPPPPPMPQVNNCPDDDCDGEVW